MIWLWVILAGGAAFYMSGKKPVTAAGNIVEDSGMLLNLPDIGISEQGGKYSTAYDSFFFKNGHKYNVPFALMKAHAIRESSLKPNAFLADRRGGSYGLLQLSWGPGNDRFAVYGYDSATLGDGQMLYDNDVNTKIAAQLIADNLRRFGNVRDAINAYNTGVAYGERVAPHNYTEDVLEYYSELIGRDVS